MKLDETEVKTIAVIPHQGRQAKYFKTLHILNSIKCQVFFRLTLRKMLKRSHLVVQDTPSLINASNCLKR